MAAEWTSREGRNGRLLIVGAVALIALSAVLAARAVTGREFQVRLGVSEELVHRPELIEAVREEAGRYGLDLELIVSGSGGVGTVKQVQQRELDAAIVFGGLGIDDPAIRQVASLRGEPLHLFARPELAAQGLLAVLKGHRVCLGPRDGETQVAVGQVLRHLGLDPATDFVAEHHTLDALLAMPAARWPDAVFLSATVPSPAGRALVQQAGYQLVAIPFAPVLALESPVVSELTIPAHAYQFDPPVPERPIPTVGCALVVIAHRDTPTLAVYRLLEVLCESDLTRRIHRKPIDTAQIQQLREYPLHTGARAFLTRNDPWLSQKLGQQFSRLKESLFSGASALVLLWGWIRSRPRAALRDLNREASTIEIAACRAAREHTLTPQRQAQFLEELAGLKLQALEAHGHLKPPRDQPLIDFLTRLERVITSVRSLPLVPLHAIKLAS